MVGEPTDTDRRWMERALVLAGEAAAVGEAPIGAVVYSTVTGEALAEARNTREGDADPCGHAELIAVRLAAQKLGDWRLNQCTVVVTLEPCAMCAGAMVNARVGRLVWGADDPKAGACRSLMALTSDRRLNHRPELVAGVEAERCGEVLRAFFRQLRERRSRA
ncbi:MAG: nucleoside deaminase [Planctomycetota bacterium]